MAKDTTAPAEKRYVKYERQIDLYNIYRDLREVTPSVCDVCGEDIVAINPRLPKYEHATDAEKKLIEALVGEHKDKVHQGERSKSVGASEVRSTYLSQSGS